MTWLDGPLVALDTETTGVDPTTDRVVSAALVHRAGGRTTVRTWLADPGVAVPECAAAVHGITTEHARAHGRPAAVVVDEVADEIAAAVRSGAPVVAFNAQYDLWLLDAELRRHGLPPLGRRLAGARVAVLDPLVLDRQLDPSREGARTLTNLCAHYGVVAAAPLHSADVDARATLDVLAAMARRHPGLTVASPAELHERQVAAHRAWVDAHAARRAAEGLPPRDHEPVWPVPHRSAPRVARPLETAPA